MTTSSALDASCAVRPLVVGCGAIVSELRTVLAADGLDTVVDTHWLPANLHNRPERIVPTLEPLLAAAMAEQRLVLVAYADCGTGGLLDALLAKFPNARRLPGAHCYEFFTGSEQFAALADEEPGTLYLTDFLAKHFDALIWQGLGLDRHPQLRDTYFGNYVRVVLLSQADSGPVHDAARAAATRLDLAFEHRPTGLQPLADAVHVGLTSRLAVSAS